MNMYFQNVFEMKFMLPHHIIRFHLFILVSEEKVFDMDYLILYCIIGTQDIQANKGRI